MNGAGGASDVAGRFHVPALDGLRACAALIVFAAHAVPAALPGFGWLAESGWCGVELFFGLSGFLVTYLLLREESREEAAGRVARFSPWRFWARRALRIWPLYFLALAVGFLLMPRLPEPWLLGPAAGTPEHALIVDRWAPASSCFLMNWVVVRHGWPTSPLFPFASLWSVSVEEQFYVMLPILLLVTRGRARRFLLIAAALASFAVRSWRVLDGDPLLSYYANTFLRADCFLAGAIFAEVVISRDGVVPTPPRWLAFAVPAAYVANSALPRLGTGGAAIGVGRYLLLDGMAVGAIWLCMVPGRYARALAWKPLAWLGTISFGFYVWHEPVLHYLSNFLAPLVDAKGRSGLFHLVRGPVSFVVTLGLAAACYALYERPFLRLKARFSGSHASPREPAPEATDDRESKRKAYVK